MTNTSTTAQLGSGQPSSADIVERLRSHAPSMGYGGCQDCYSLVMDDAADEIERLRATPVEAARAQDNAELIARLRGRALFLRNRGGQKSPDLMERAASALSVSGDLAQTSDGALYAAISRKDTPPEEWAELMDSLTVSSTENNTPRCEHGNPVGVCTICHMWSEVSRPQRESGQ